MAVAVMHRLGHALYSTLDDIAERGHLIAAEIGPCWLVLIDGGLYALTESEPRYGEVLGKLTGREDVRYIRALIDGEASLNGEVNG
jgi:hypothetical protein